MKKKIISTPKDKKDWSNFTKEMGKINAKEIELLQIQLEEIKVNTSNPLSTQ